MNDSIIKAQLAKVEYADLSNFDAATNTYIIKKKQDIKVEADKDYLIKLKPAAYNNSAVITNWNNGTMPADTILKVNILKCMGKMIQVIGVGYNIDTKVTSSTFWRGWLATSDIEILQKL